jgi:hypothetical protein
MATSGSLFLLALGALSFAGTPVLAAAKNSNPRALIGNTVHGKDVAAGAEYWSYFKPDGTGVVTDGASRESFTWIIKGDQLCEKHSWSGLECSSFQLNGSTGIETVTEGTGVGDQSHMEILKGNPKGL